MPPRVGRGSEILCQGRGTCQILSVQPGGVGLQIGGVQLRSGRITHTLVQQAEKIESPDPFGRRGGTPTDDLVSHDGEIRSGHLQIGAEEQVGPRDHRQIGIERLGLGQLRACSPEAPERELLLRDHQLAQRPLASRPVWGRRAPEDLDGCFPVLELPGAHGPDVGVAPAPDVLE